MGIFVVCEDCHSKVKCNDWNGHKLKTLTKCSKCEKLTSCVKCEIAFKYYHFRESEIINENSDA